jgi:hypothetical protein
MMLIGGKLRLFLPRKERLEAPITEDNSFIAENSRLLDRGRDMLLTLDGRLALLKDPYPAFGTILAGAPVVGLTSND